MGADTPTVMLAAPLYFGPQQRSRFGFLHWPPGPVRGAVAICPPLAYEAVCAHRTLRQLSEEFARAGFVTLRFDYDGTGNSIGASTDTDRLSSWLGSVDDAVTELRALGLPPVTLVGLRFGATLAACAAAERTGDISSLVLWDPVETGRRYARELRLLGAAAGPGADAMAADGVTVAGITFTDDALAELRDVTIPGSLRAADTLVLNRSDPAVMAGTSALLDGDAERAVVPHDIVRSIVEWTGRRSPLPLEQQPSPPRLRDQAVEDSAGSLLEHRAVRVGAAGLFAVQTARIGAAPSRAIFMINNGVAGQVGPGRAWIGFAQRFAAKNWLAVRLDLSGLGDSPARAGRPDNEAYPIAAAADVAEAVAQLRSQGVMRVAVIGLCSGALIGFDAALSVPEIDVLLAINGAFHKPFTGGRRERLQRAAGPTARLLAFPMRKAPLWPFFDAVPTWLWRSLDGMRLAASPARIIEMVLRRGRVEVVLLFGESEWGLKALRRRGGRRFARVLDDAAVSLIEVPGLDHSMFDPAARMRVESTLLEILASTDQRSSELR
ncbi:MAG: hypothetical protein ABI912_11480 [Actinomycetota bacterium]